MPARQDDRAAGRDVDPVDPVGRAEAVGIERHRRARFDRVEGDRLTDDEDVAARGRIAEVDRSRRVDVDIAAGNDRIEPGREARRPGGQISVRFGMFDARRTGAVEEDVGPVQAIDADPARRGGERQRAAGVEQASLAAADPRSRDGGQVAARLDRRGGTGAVVVTDIDLVGGLDVEVGADIENPVRLAIDADRPVADQRGGTGRPDGPTVNADEDSRVGSAGVVVGRGRCPKRFGGEAGQGHRTVGDQLDPSRQLAIGADSGVAKIDLCRRSRRDPGLNDRAAARGGARKARRTVRIGPGAAASGGPRDAVDVDRHRFAVRRDRAAVREQVHGAAAARSAVAPCAARQPGAIVVEGAVAAVAAGTGAAERDDPVRVGCEREHRALARHGLDRAARPVAAGPAGRPDGDVAARIAVRERAVAAAAPGDEIRLGHSDARVRPHRLDASRPSGRIAAVAARAIVAVTARAAVR